MGNFAMDEVGEERKDIRMEVRFKNNLILKKLASRGIKSVAELCRKMKAPESFKVFVHNIINMQMAPITKKGVWRKQVKDLCSFLECSPEELFSLEQIDLVLSKNKAVVEMSFESIRNVLEQQHSEMPALEDVVGREQLRQLVSQILTTHLSPRDQLIIKNRFGFDDKEEQSLDEIGNTLGISRARVQQLEARAFRKLRRLAANDLLGFSSLHSLLNLD